MSISYLKLFSYLNVLISTLSVTKGFWQLMCETGKIVPRVHTGPPCKCRKKCFDLFTDTRRYDISKSLYSLATKNLQDAHLFSLITSKPIKR